MGGGGSETQHSDCTAQADARDCRTCRQCREVIFTLRNGARSGLTFLTPQQQTRLPALPTGHARPAETWARVLSEAAFRHVPARGA